MILRWSDTRHGLERAGFSILEAVMVLLVVFVVVGTLTPKVASLLTHSRVDRAAGVASSDFYLAQSLAARAREPVVVTVSSSAKTIRITSYSGDTLVTRYYGSEGEWKVGAISASPATTLVLPSGMATASMTVSITYEDYTRQVKLSRAGQIRIIR